MVGFTMQEYYLDTVGIDYTALLKFVSSYAFLDADFRESAARELLERAVDSEGVLAVVVKSPFLQSIYAHFLFIKKDPELLAKAFEAMDDFHLQVYNVFASHVGTSTVEPAQMQALANSLSVAQKTIFFSKCKGRALLWWYVGEGDSVGAHSLLEASSDTVFTARDVASAPTRPVVVEALDGEGTDDSELSDDEVSQPDAAVEDITVCFYNVKSLHSRFLLYSSLLPWSNRPPPENRLGSHGFLTTSSRLWRATICRVTGQARTVARGAAGCGLVGATGF
jgi:hypothetical protein